MGKENVWRVGGDSGLYLGSPETTRFGPVDGVTNHRSRVSQPGRPRSNPVAEPAPVAEFAACVRPRAGAGTITPVRKQGVCECVRPDKRNAEKSLKPEKRGLHFQSLQGADSQAQAH